MGNLISSKHFPDEQEVDLYNLYFSIVDNNVTGTNIPTPSRKPTRSKPTINSMDIGINHCQKGVTSLMYLVQFVSPTGVVDEISIQARYSSFQDGVKLTFRKHQLGNMTTDHEDERYKYRVGFPSHSYIFNQRVIVKLVKFANQFLIVAVEGGQYNFDAFHKTHFLGILQFKTSEDVGIDPIVRTLVRVNRRILTDTPSFDLKLNAPMINNGRQTMRLSHFAFRPGRVKDKTITIGHGIIEEVDVDKEIVDIYSWLPYPKHLVSVRRIQQFPTVVYRLFGLEKAY